MEDRLKLLVKIVIEFMIIFTTTVCLILAFMDFNGNIRIGDDFKG